MKLRQNPRMKRYEPSARVQRKIIKRMLYKERVKAMRPYFGDLFKASSGYDLRQNVDNWTPAMKARVTRYWRVIAPQISRPHKPRYFRRQDRLLDAIEYTQQEEFLPGQTAALFSADPDEKLDVNFTKDGNVLVYRQGIGVKKVPFDVITLIEEPAKAIQDALDELEGATRFKIMMGPHESRGTFTKQNVIDGIQYFLAQYSDDEFDPYDQRSQWFGNWLGGLIGYYGTGRQVTRYIDKERKKRDSRIKRYRELKAERRKDARRTAKDIQRKKRGKKKRRK